MAPVIQPVATAARLPQNASSLTATLQLLEKDPGYADFCRRLSERWYKVRELAELERETGYRARRGRFSRPEEQALQSAIQEYIKENGLKYSQLVTRLEERHGRDSTFDELFLSLAQKLPGRSVIHIYHHVRRMCHSGARVGRFSAEEDAALRNLVALHGTQWEVIAKHMPVHRLPHNLRDRYRLLSTRKRTGPWTDEEVRMLCKVMADLYGAEAGDQTEIPWTAVSERVGTRSPHQCMKKWVYCTRLGLPGPSGTRQPVRFDAEQDLALCQIIYKLGYEDVSEIQWPIVAERLVLRGQMNEPDSYRLQQRFKRICQRVEGSKFMSLDGILESLMQRLQIESSD